MFPAGGLGIADVVLLVALRSEVAVSLTLPQTYNLSHLKRCPKFMFAT